MQGYPCAPGLLMSLSIGETTDICQQPEKSLPHKAKCVASSTALCACSRPRLPDLLALVTLKLPAVLSLRGSLWPARLVSLNLLLYFALINNVNNRAVRETIMAKTHLRGKCRRAACPPVGRYTWRWDWRDQ